MWENYNFCSSRLMFQKKVQLICWKCSRRIVTVNCPLYLDVLERLSRKVHWTRQEIQTNPAVNMKRTTKTKKLQTIWWKSPQKRINLEIWRESRFHTTWMIPEVRARMRNRFGRVERLCQSTNLPPRKKKKKTTTMTTKTKRKKKKKKWEKTRLN